MVLLWAVNEKKEKAIDFVFRAHRSDLRGLAPELMKAAVIYSFKATFSLTPVALLQTSWSFVLVFVHTQSPQTAGILGVLDIYFI